MNSNVKFLIDNQKKLRYYLNYINKGSSDNEDILQEFNEKFLIHSDKLGEVSFEYLKNGVKNTLIDRKRRNKVRGWLNTPSKFENSFTGTEDDNNHEEVKLYLRELFYDCKLTPKEQKVLILFLFSDKSQKEIAKEIGWKYVSYRTRLLHARKKLSKHKKKFENLFDLNTCIY